MGEFLEDEAKKLMKIFRNGCLRGVVVCGPLAPVEVVKWFSPFLEKLSGGVVQDDAQPRVNSLWLASTCDDPIAIGAQIYGKRLSVNQPTYLDTLPQISTLVLERGEYSWIHLVDTEECEGGKEYENEINNKFIISKEYDWVGFYLKKKKYKMIFQMTMLMIMVYRKTLLDQFRMSLKVWEVLKLFYMMIGMTGMLRRKNILPIMQNFL